MATFSQNIRKIEGQAVYAPEMRTAISEALQQAIDVDITIDGLVTVTTTPIAQTTNEYLLTFTVSEPNE